MIFNPQFSALSAFSSIGLGDYHAMQWSIRKRFSGGLLFYLNYTDLGSTSEAGINWNPNGTTTESSFSGFIQKHLESGSNAGSVVL